MFGHKPWKIKRDDCSRCGEELPGLGPAAGATVVSAMLPDAAWKRPEARKPLNIKLMGIRRDPMIPWWGLGPPPGWREPTSEERRTEHFREMVVNQRRIDEAIARILK